MSESTINREKFGIAARTSVYAGIIVFILLGIAAILLISFQSDLAGFILETYSTNVKSAIDEQGENQQKSLHASAKINAKIASGISASYLYNVDAENLMTSLKTYITLEEIVAIQVLDTDKAAFAAAWKNPDIQSGEKIPDSLDLSAVSKAQADSYNGNEKVGQIIIYYTDKMLLTQLEKGKTKASNQIAEFRKTVDARLNKGIVYQWIGIFFVLICLIGTILFCMKVVTILPIQKVVEGLKDIAQGEGDLTSRLEIKRMDEVGELSAWFNLFIEKLQDMIRDIAQNAKVVTQASGHLLNISENLSNGAEHMSGLSNTVTVAAEEMSANMNSVSAAMEETSINVNLIASATEEMTSVINEIASNTEKARTISNNAVVQAKSASAKVAELGKAAQDIGNVTETIAKISGQTNLLALNATIEASRAGDAGRGFAVVANEIKELAGQTATATQEIKGEIEGIQGSASGTVSEIEQISLVINDVNDVVATIATAVEEQSVSTKEIATNVGHASTGIQEVNENVAQSSTVSNEISKDIASVNQEATETTNISNQVNSNAQDLAKLAQELTNMVGRFKV